MSEPYTDLLDQTVIIAGALNLSLSSALVTVEKRKLPTADETLDTALLPLLAVVPEELPVRDEPFDTERRLREYAIGLCIITRGTRDTKENLDVYLGWRRQLQVAFGVEEPWSLDSYLRHRVLMKPPFNRALWSKNYDYLAMALLVQIVEAP